MEGDHSGPEAAATVPAHTVRASIGQRFAASLIDQLIVGLATGCVSSVFGFISSAGGDPWWSELAGGVVLLIEAMYFIWPYSTGGQTIGKRAMKIKVISCDGSPLNWRKGLLRTMGYVLSSIPFGFGFLWALWDPDGQAGHDKIAATYVVPISFAPEPLKERVPPAATRRTRIAWLVGLAVPSLAVVAVLLGLVKSAVSEVEKMGPWPGTRARSRDLASVDLSALDLDAGRVQDARAAHVWTGASYAEGALATYSYGGNTVVSIWVLKYADSTLAAGDFDAVEAGFAEPGGCGMSSYATLWSSGVLHCQYSDGYQKVFWQDSWIVGIEALGGTNNSPDVLVDLVRDALAAHWKTTAKAASQ